MPDLFSKLLHPAALFAWTLAFLAMRTLMIDLGVAADRLVLERKSRNAGENATATARIVAAKGWGSRPRVLVTSAIHMPRAFATFRKAGLEACAFAAERRRDSIDPVNFFFEDCLRSGITTINVQQGNDCIVAAQGMVVRYRSTMDRRIVHARLTDQGWEALTTAPGLLRTDALLRWSALSLDQKQALADAMELLSTLMTAHR